jgi:hypothetical protein
MVKVTADGGAAFTLLGGPAIEAGSAMLKIAIRMISL